MNAQVPAPRFFDPKNPPDKLDNELSPKKTFFSPEGLAIFCIENGDQKIVYEIKATVVDSFPPLP